MFRRTFVSWICLLLPLLNIVQISYAQDSVTTIIEGEARAYNCKRLRMGCKNGGKCENGACTCTEDFTGHDCGVEKAAVGCSELQCQNNGICYKEGENDMCYCPPTHYGDTCDQETDTWECLGTEMKIEIMVPDSFSGTTYGSASRSDCAFTEVASSVAGYKKLSSSITFDNTTCSAIKIQDYPKREDVTYVVDIIVGFHPFLQLKTDRLITFNCTHPASNVSMEADINSNINERDHLTRNEEKKTYSPVRFHFLDADDAILRRALTVGEEFTNIVYLISTDVYKDLLLEKCVASNGDDSNEKRVDLLEKGCPTQDGALVMVDPPGQKKKAYTPPNMATPVPAVALDMLGFRFYDSKHVFIQCVVKICKPQHADACQMPTCNGFEAGQVAKRRKRSSDTEPLTNNTTDEETVTALFTVTERPVVIEEKPIVKPQDVSDCFHSKEIIVVIIVMSALVLLMLMACVVLASLIFRSRGKVRKLVQKTASQDHGFRIPRAKITC